MMTNPLHALLLDLVEWIAKEPRLYSEALEAWRTSCPRLMVWEDAVDRGYVAREPFDGRPPSVKVTPLGQIFLQQNGRPCFPGCRSTQASIARVCSLARECATERRCDDRHLQSTRRKPY